MAAVADAQPAILWQKTYGGSADDLGFYMRQTADSGFVATGVTYSVDSEVTGYHGTGDVWVIKTTSTGDLIWEHCYGGSGYEEGDCIQQNNDGGYILAGYTNSTDGDITQSYGGYDGWLTRLDSTGAIIWQHNFGGSGIDLLTACQQTNDGGFIVAGSTTSNNGNVHGNHGGVGYDIWVMKLDDTGGIAWSKTYGGTGDDEGLSIELTTDGGYIVGGYTASVDGDVSGFHGGPADYWVLKLNDTGGIQWKQTLGGSGDDELQSATQTLDGGYIVTGNSNSTNGDVTGNHGGYDMFTVRLSGSGSVVWKKCYGGTGDDDGQCVRQSADGGFIIAGSTYSDDGQVTGSKRGGDVWLVKTDANGNLQWQKDAGGDSLDIGFSVVPTLDGSYAVLGFTESADSDVSFNHGPAGTADFWLFKLTPPVVNSVSEVIPSGDAVIYPNPTSGIVHLLLPSEFADEQIKVFDVLGREVTMATFNRQCRLIDLSDQSSGMYLISITNNNNTSVYNVIRN